MQSNSEIGDGPKKLKENQKSGKFSGDIIAGDDNSDDDLNLDSQELKPSLTKSGNGIQPKPSRKGGWGTDSSRSGKKKRNELEGEYEDARLRPKTQQEDGGADSDPDAPFIPEIETETFHGGRGDGQVAMAPQVAVNRVATYKELDNELLKHSTFLVLDNEIDLKLLAKRLSSEAEVAEDDVTWDWDHLFADVSSDLLTEWENQDQGPEKTGA